MNKLLKKTLALIVGDDANTGSSKSSKAKKLVQITERDLLREESAIGATLFGSVPKGHRREFFCLDESTWIWYEEWRDEKGIERRSTVRYEIHPNGILKVSDGPRHQYLEGAELANFVEATRIYYEQAMKQVYKRDPKTGLKFA